LTAQDANMTWISLETINRRGPLLALLILTAASACAASGFSLSGWLWPVHLLSSLRTPTLDQ
jgi:hypothetical protein